MLMEDLNTFRVTKYYYYCCCYINISVYGSIFFGLLENERIYLKVFILM